jgi:hypothetical protein
MLAADAKDVYNGFEPFIWYALAILLVPAIRKHSPLRERIFLALVVAAFGTSDFYETIAWWTPWWLLMWKVICLLVATTMSLRIWKRSKKGSQSLAATPSSPARLP